MTFRYKWQAIKQDTTSDSVLDARISYTGAGKGDRVIEWRGRGGGRILSFSSFLAFFARIIRLLKLRARVRVIILTEI